MLLVGLTGGIGSGKSTVARMLAERGAVLLDADVFSREALEPGTDAHAGVVRLFGRDVLRPDGRLDRAKIGQLVFTDEALRSKLERIVHPEVHRRSRDAIEALRETDAVVVYDAALIYETGRQGEFDVMVVVTAPEDRRVARLVAKGMSEEDARRRMAAQLPLAEKAAVADVVLDNSGSAEELERQVDGLWRHLEARARAE